MYDYLDAKRFREVDNCDVFVETVADVPAEGSSSRRRRFDKILQVLAVGTAICLLAGTALW